MAEFVTRWEAHLERTLVEAGGSTTRSQVLWKPSEIDVRHAIDALQREGWELIGAWKVDGVERSEGQWRETRRRPIPVHGRDPGARVSTFAEGVRIARRACVEAAMEDGYSRADAERRAESLIGRWLTGAQTGG